MNNGAWTYVGPRILTAANETQYHKGKYPYYAGRQPTSSVATGSKVSSLVFDSLPALTQANRPSTRKRSRSFWPLPLLNRVRCSVIIIYTYHSGVCAPVPCFDFLVYPVHGGLKIIYYVFKTAIRRELRSYGGEYTSRDNHACTRYG